MHVVSSDFYDKGIFGALIKGGIISRSLVFAAALLELLARTAKAASVATCCLDGEAGLPFREILLERSAFRRWHRGRIEFGTAVVFAAVDPTAGA
jgi:hypothetical protein